MTSGPAGPARLRFSSVGDKMAQPSGLRQIMDDIAATIGASQGSEWLNLSIGNPALIPQVVAGWRLLTEQALADDFPTASCQYGPSRGAPAFVEAITAYFNRRYGWSITPANVVVGPGSQFLGFAAAALFTGPAAGGARRLVLPLTPDYTGYEGMALTRDAVVGVSPCVQVDGPRSFRYTIDFGAVEDLRDAGMLVASSPANPTGRSLSEAELLTLLRIAERRDVPLFVDNAYGEPFPCIGAGLAPIWHDNVINSFTVSKAGLPGERIGFAIGAERYISAMASFMANSVLHAPQLNQMVVARALATGALDSMVESFITPFYRQRRALAAELLESSLPADIDWRLHSGNQGMFSWLWVRHDWFDDLAFYEQLKRAHVFVTPGSYFFVRSQETAPGGHSAQCIRVSLSCRLPVLEEGIRRIATGLRAMQQERAAAAGPSITARNPAAVGPAPPARRPSRSREPSPGRGG
jgi:valine--pyruvate aminotransferase